MDPMTLALLAQGGMGIYQAMKGFNMGKNLQRPEYQIPEEAQQALSSAEVQALEGLPAQQVQNLTQNIQRSTSTGLNQLSDRKAGLAGIPSVVQSEQDSMNNLMAQDAQQRMQNMQNLQQQRGIMSEYRDKIYQLNQLDPYFAQAQAAQSMKGAGFQNIYGALGSGAQMYGDYKNYQDLYNLLMGGDQQPNQSVSTDLTTASSQLPSASNEAQQVMYQNQNPSFGNPINQQPTGLNNQQGIDRNSILKILLGM